MTRHTLFVRLAETLYRIERPWGDVPMGVSPENALDGIRLIMIANDVSLRNLIPNELTKGFGFFQSKPATAFSPVAVSSASVAHGLSTNSGTTRRRFFA